MSTVAIYSRKSKFTCKGESIENQIQMCKEYAYKHFDSVNHNIIIYEDEGFSGGNVERPKFKIMMNDAKKKKFDILICYRLDRISRNVLDFSQIVETLSKYDISFVSIKEQFDTSTPMGRAMMYISSVFAQLERETIAERIRDNMQRLALSGRWLGGKTPYGFRSKQIISIDHEGKKKKSYKLIPEPKEIEIIKLIYKKYLKLESFTKVESYLIQNDVKRNGTFFNQSTISYILRNPVYCTAEPISFEYFNNIGSSICDYKKFNSKNGLIGYSKRDEKKWIINKKENWFIGVGKHIGIIPAKDWIKVQNIIDNNKHKSIKSGTSTTSLITPLLKCSCGETMKSTRVSRDKEGNLKYAYYICRRKERTNGRLCSMKNLNAIKADNIVVESLKNIAFNNNYLMSKFKKEIKSFVNNKETKKDKKKNIINEIDKRKEKIENLVEYISDNKNTAASTYILDKINDIDTEIQALISKLNEIKSYNDMDIIKELDLEIQLALLDNIKNTDAYTFHEKQQIIHRLIDNIVWDGNKLHIYIKAIDFTNCIT